MTRRDYTLIADAIRVSLNRFHEEGDDAYRGVHDAANTLATTLGSANPRFDRTRFLKACGF